MHFLEFSDNKSVRFIFGTVNLEFLMLDNADAKQRRAKKDQGCDADGASGQHARTYIRKAVQRGQQVDAKESGNLCRQESQ